MIQWFQNFKVTVCKVINTFKNFSQKVLMDLIPLFKHSFFIFKITNCLNKFNYDFNFILIHIFCDLKQTQRNKLNEKYGYKFYNSDIYLTLLATLYFWQKDLIIKATKLLALMEMKLQFANRFIESFTILKINSQDFTLVINNNR